MGSKTPPAIVVPRHRLPVESIVVGLLLGGCGPAGGPAAAPPAAGILAPSATASAAAASATEPSYVPPNGLPTGREPLGEAIPIADSDLVRGRASVLVDAPIAAVRKAVLDFGHYAEFMPHYRTARVVGRDSKHTRVYMQVVAINGVLKMGAQITMPNAPRVVAGTEVYESEMLGGNVEDFRAVWCLKSLAADQTLLTLEVFMLPRLPMLTSILNKENTRGAVKGVVAMRDRIEGQKKK